MSMFAPWGSSQYVLNVLFDPFTGTISAADSTTDQEAPVYQKYMEKYLRDVLQAYPEPHPVVIQGKRFHMMSDPAHHSKAFDQFVTLSFRSRTREMMNSCTFYRHFDCPSCGRMYPPVNANVFIDITNGVLLMDTYVSSRVRELFG